MEGWKKALVVGTLGAGAVLVMTRRRPAGAVFAAAGLALLASEYPEKFEAIWENAPEYMNRATQILGVISKISERFAEAAEKRSSEAWHSLQEEYGA
ncbi:MAG: hypothetical protein ROO76_21380 [Terriglobia bacterium]|jgi:hypothetical protein|nr:hypothetical protein [Terriglobia bacterium]